MAGAGSRFSDAGYIQSKPVLPIIDRQTGRQLPMVVAATKELAVGQDISSYIFVDRDFHKASGVQGEIGSYFSNAKFVTLTELSDGQASTCLMAKALINDNEELLVGACDNGVDYCSTTFNDLRGSCDALIFTYRNNELVLDRPEAHGWVYVEEDGKTVKRISVKKPISDTPLNDHAIVASFWFKRGKDFISASEKMIKEDDRVNGEFYADQVMHHALDMGLTVKVIEVDRYFCWGTPKDYESYQQTFSYWKQFVGEEEWL